LSEQRPAYEVPKAAVLCAEKFSEDKELVTPTNKLRRLNLTKYFKVRLSLQGSNILSLSLLSEFMDARTKYRRRTARWSRPRAD
jgi:hypothetical protein